MKQSKSLSSLVFSGVLLLFFSAIGLAHQDELGSSSIFLGDGYLFVNNGEDKSVTFVVRGRAIEPVSSGSNPTFKLDGKILQVLFIKNKDFQGNTKNATEDKLLELHQRWESDYLENDIYHKKLNLESEKISLNNRTMLFWGFTRPGLADEYDRDYFLTAVVGSRVLGLSSPIRKGESVSDYKKLFTEVLSTLKISDKPFDITKLAEEVRKGEFKRN